MNAKSDKPNYPGNSIMVRPNGPLICKSDQEITLLNADNEVIRKEKELVLCRCGLSKNKPFCDSAHYQLPMLDAETFSDEREEDITGLEGELVITAKKNAMFSISGPVTIFTRDGLSKTTRTKAALCRCGESANKPFCDASHKKCNFEA